MAAKRIPSKNILFFLFLLVVKFILCWFIIEQSHCAYSNGNDFSFFLSAGDTFSYIDSFINLKEYGQYYFENFKGDKVYAGRMPVYGSLFGMLYPVLDEESLFSIYVILQIIVETFGAYVLVSLVGNQFPTARITKWIVGSIVTLSTFQTFWSAKLIPESLGVSLMILLIALVVMSRGKAGYSIWLLIGILLMLIVGLKPYLGILIIPLSFEIYRQHRPLYKTLVKKLALTVLPLLVFMSFWTTRNWIVLGKFIPLTEQYSGYNFLESQLALRDFLAAKGVSQEYWDKKAEASFYYGRETVFELKDLYTDVYITRDSLQVVQAFFSKNSNTVSSEFSELEITSMLARMTLHYTSIYPLHDLTGFFSRLRLSLFHSGSYYLPISQSSPCYASWQWGFKIIQSLFYYFLLVFGCLGLFIWRDWTLWFIPAFLALFFCGALQFVELRYFLYLYASLILGTAASLAAIEKKIRNRFSIFRH